MLWKGRTTFSEDLFSVTEGTAGTDFNRWVWFLCSNLQRACCVPAGISAVQALDTRYFRTYPVCPENISELPPLELPDHGGSYHEFQTKRKRKEDGILQQDAKRAQKKKVCTVATAPKWKLKTIPGGILQMVGKL